MKLQAGRAYGEFVTGRNVYGFALCLGAICLLKILYTLLFSVSLFHIMDKFTVYGVF